MAKQSQLDKAIDKIQQEIEVLQMAKVRLEEQRPAALKAAARVKPAGNHSEA